LKRIAHGTLIRSIALSPDARQVVTGASNNNLSTWALDGSASTSFGLGQGPFNAVAYTPDGHRVLAGPAGVPVLWDLRTGQIHYLHAGVADIVECIAVAPNGHTAVTGSAHGIVRVWNLDTLAEIGVVGTFEGNLIAVAYSPDGQRIHGANHGGDLKVWKLKTGELLMSRRHLIPRTGPDGKVVARRLVTVTKAAFSPDGTLLVVGCPDGAARLYDVMDEGRELRHVNAHKGTITGVAFSPDASRTDLALWETATGRQLSTMRLPQQQSIHGAMALLSTNRHLLFGGNGISLVLMPQDESPGPASRPAGN
jgi:WD40 repeat protein